MVVFGSDHAGYDLKMRLIEHIKALGHEVRDLGCCAGEKADYPVYGEAAAREVAAGRADFAVVICGTGIGISMAANKVEGIRAALCTNEYMARMARLHNDANVLALGGRVLGDDLAFAIAETFLTTEFEGGRHAGRVRLIMDIENRHKSAGG
jgi:ribose 5-phosphate isomerase B